MLHYLPSILVGIYFALTNVDITIDGRKPSSFSECPITVVFGDTELGLTDIALPERLTHVDSFYLKGSSFLAGIKTGKFATTGFLKVKIDTALPMDSLETQMACVPKSGYVRATISNKETTRTYIMHSGKLIYSINGIKVIGTTHKRTKKRNKN